MSGSFGDASSTSMLAGRRIAIVGNSNSVATAGYVPMLQARYGADVVNASIGALPNIVLVAFATDEDLDFSSFDVIVVETAVIETIMFHPGSRYTTQRSAENIDVFMSYMRLLTNAEIVFLILPTVPDFVAPEHAIIEQHYLDAAARHGAHVLNLKSLFRSATSFDPQGLGREATSHARTLLEAIGCPRTLPDMYGLRRLLYQAGGETQRSEVVPKGFAADGFKDWLHISRPVHSLVAELLANWIQRLPEREPFRRPAGDIPNVIARIQPSGPDIEMVSREASLISRRLAVLKEGGSVVYRCPPGYQALAIMTNEIVTAGYLRMESAGERTVVHCPRIVMPPQFKWLAKYRLIDDPLGADITVTVSSTPQSPTGDGSGQAELAEMLVIDTDWRAKLAPFGAVTPTQPATIIENEDWAREIATRTARYCAEGYFDTRWDNVVIDKPSFRRLIESVCVTDNGEPRRLDQAKLFAAAEEYDWAAAALDQALAQSPDDAAATRLRAAVAAIIHVKP